MIQKSAEIYMPVDDSLPHLIHIPCSSFFYTFFHPQHLSTRKSQNLVVCTKFVYNLLNLWISVEKALQ